MLKAKQKNCIDMLVKGELTQAEIAKELNIAEKTICLWKKDDEFINEYDKLNKISIQSLVPKAINTMNALLKSESDNVRFSAAKDILDRAGYKAQDKLQIDGNLQTETSKLDELIRQMKGNE